MQNTLIRHAPYALSFSLKKIRKGSPKMRFVFYFYIFCPSTNQIKKYYIFCAQLKLRKKIWVAKEGSLNDEIYNLKIGKSVFVKKHAIGHQQIHKHTPTNQIMIAVES